MEQHLKNLEEHLAKLVQSLRLELQGIRGARPMPQLIENIRVNYLGEMLSVKQLGSISVKPPREIDITVWDPQALQPVAKAIEAANIGVTAAIDGSLIRCTIPPLTEERRQEIIKLVKKMAEEVRVKVRQGRDETNKKIKSNEPDEDRAFKYKERIQKIVDNANSEIEKLVESKIGELED